jgi:hypothetical protein
LPYGAFGAIIVYQQRNRINMLVDIKFNPDARMERVMAALAGIDGVVERQHLATGVYEIGSFSFHYDCGIDDRANMYPTLTNRSNEYMGNYGVCDSWEQVVALCSELDDANKTPYVLSVTKISKATEPPFDGWRWHKWGEYIGTHEPECEYLYDEVGIDAVYVFHIYHVPEHLVISDLCKA